MDSSLQKDHNRPAHNAMNTDTTKADEATAEEHINAIANKAAGKGLERQRQDESDSLFTK